MTTQPDKLSYLLQILWKSPVFGDSYPPNTNKNITLKQFEEMQTLLTQMIFPILQAGMPEASPEKVQEIIAQIGPKSLAFCAAISAGEIWNRQQLLHVTGEIAIIYWADQSMDRGDTWVLAAVQHLNQQPISDDILASPLFQARLKALNHIRTFAQQITSSVEDLTYIVKAIQNDILENEAHLQTLSQKFSQDPSDFWKHHTRELSQVMIDCSGLMCVGTAIYASHRSQHPALPSLQEIYDQPDLMRLVKETFNPAVRVFDDVGDCFVDTGENPSWGVFNLNIVNQNQPQFVDYFLQHSGIFPEHPLYEQAIEVFALPLAERRTTLAHFYLDLCRQRVEELPPELWQRYGIFLTLSKRILEAAFVNMLGDVFLAENTSFATLDSELLNLIQEAGL
jgi:hypothetical protein